MLRITLRSPVTWRLLLAFLLMSASASDSSSTCGLPDVDETGGLVIKYKGHAVGHDQQVSLKAATDPPDMTVDLEGGESLLVLLIDPDAPRPEACPDKYWLHWIATASVQGKAVKIGNTLLKYYPPSPPAESNPHRYQLLLYSHSQEVAKSVVPAKRSGFDLGAFLKAAGIQGDPVATIQFKAGHSMP